MFHSKTTPLVRAAFAARNADDIPRPLLSIPKFNLAVQAFASVLKQDDPNVDMEDKVFGLKEWFPIPEPLSPQAPAVFDLLSSLPSIGARRLPHEDGNCIICSDPFDSSAAAWSADSVVARRLPCGHIACAVCLLQWLTPFTRVQNNSCPHCRIVLFPKFVDADQIQGMQQRADAADWYGQEHGELPFEWKGVEGNVKLLLLGHKLAAAMEEVELDTVLALIEAPNPEASSISDFNTEQKLSIQEMCLRKALVGWLIFHFSARMRGVFPEVDTETQEVTEAVILRSLKRARWFRVQGQSKHEDEEAVVSSE